MQKFLSLFLAFFVATNCFAQKEDIQFEHLSMKDGLSMNPVMSIIQDKKGFIWFGTQDGLNRYDGYNFSVYKSNDEDTSSISDNFITAQCVDNQGNLWIGTLNGLNKYNSLTGKFRQFVKAGADFPSEKVYCLFKDKNGLIWVGTENGIGLFDPALETFVDLKSKYTSISVLQQKTVLCIFQDNKGTYWFGTSSGLIKFDPSSDILQNFYSNTNKDGALSNNIVLSIYQDKKNNIWFGTLDGLNRYDAANNRFIHQYFKKSTEELTSTKKNNAIAGTNIYSIVNNYGGNTIRSIIEDVDGWFWIGTDMELIIFDPVTGKYFNYKKDLINPTGINDHFIRSIYMDHSNNMWVGTLGNGLNKVNLKPKKFAHYQKKINNPSSLSENYVRSICEDGDKNLWIGTLVGGLNQFDPISGIFKHYQKGSGDLSKYINDNNVWSVCYDKSINSVWLGTNNGLDLLDLKNQTFKHFQHKEGLDGNISDNTIRNVFIDSKGNLWCGTENGLNLFDRQTETFTYFNKTNSAISNNTVWKIIEDKTGKLWLATNEGLNCFDPGFKKFTVFKKAESGSASGLCHNSIRTLYLDKANMLWIGTQNGMNKLDLQTMAFSSFEEKDGLPNPFIYGIIEDENQHLWISTNKGISEFDKKNAFKNYDIYDGLQDYEFNTNACFRASSGDIYFGGPSGLNRFNPSSIQSNSFIPPVVITSIKILDTAYSVRDVSELEELQLLYDENILNISFSSLDYTNSSRNKYMYKLEGFNDNWIDAGNLHYISYTNLDPGNYTLLIKGSNSDGIWNEEPCKLRITISPPFWKTWWFYSLCVITVLVSIFVFIRVRTRSLIRTKQILEHKVKKRTEEVEMQKDELSQKNKDITDSINYAKRIQNSILSGEQTFKDSFSDAFVLYQPRDIVSGDFYWITQVHTSDERKLDLKIVSAVDCTGHGVPGAFMSLIASDLLNQTIKDRTVNSPGEVLRFLNQKLPLALNKNNSEKINDGMDMAVCAIDSTNNKVYYAGANRPLWMVNHKGEFSEIKATKTAVGGYTELDHVFENHTIPVEKGDTLYMFSDGYADQFGGEKNKKLGTKKFRELIHSIAGKSMPLQKEMLESFFNQWRGSNDQLDDLLVIGIKI